MEPTSSSFSSWYFSPCRSLAYDGNSGATWSCELTRGHEGLHGVPSVQDWGPVWGPTGVVTHPLRCSALHPRSAVRCSRSKNHSWAEGHFDERLTCVGWPGAGHGVVMPTDRRERRARHRRFLALTG
jgi:hypothetical protein